MPVELADCTRRYVSFLPCMALIAVMWAAMALAGEIGGDLDKGAAFAQANCARCHAVARTGSSALPLAPPFRDLPGRYPLESLYEAFAEGITVGHSDMPEFVLEPDQITNLLAFIQSLAAKGTE